MYTPVDWPTPDLVAVRARTDPQQTALVDADTGEAWTYRELSDGPVDTLAAGVRGAGVSAGAHLGVLLPPGARMAHLVFAASRAGVVLVPLPPGAPAEVVAERAGVADVDAVVCGPTTERTALRAFDGPVFAVDAEGSSAADSLEDHAASSPPAYWWDPGQVQWLVFTSGTVSEPEAVQLTARNLVASATASALRLGVDPDDRWLGCLPMHHVSGLGPIVRSALYGTAAVVQSDFDADDTAAAMARFDVTGVSLVPTMLGRLLDAGWTPSPSLRFVLLGGAPASRELVERCEDASVPVNPTYGATETATQVATAAPGEAFDHPGSVGRPLMGVEVTVLAANGGPAESGQPGELVVAGPQVAPGYFGNPRATADRFGDRGFRTRDRGYRDGGGRLHVLGRLDDAILTGGETVDPRLVESALLDHDEVEDVAVLGLQDEAWGEVVGAVVALEAGARTDGDDLRAHCRGRLEPHEVPKLVATTEALPRTASGTVDRNAVRDRLRRLDPSDGV